MYILLHYLVGDIVPELAVTNPVPDMLTTLMKHRLDAL
jgi:hypothetical protein